MELLSRLRTAGKVASLFLWIAPGTVRVPVPCLDLQLRILPVGHGLPSRPKRRLENRAGQQLICVLFYFFFGDAAAIHLRSALARAQPVYARTQCTNRAKGIDGVRWRSIHHNR